MYAGRSLAIELDGSPQLVRGMAATPSLFRLLTVAPALGRAFDESEGEIGNELGARRCRLVLLLKQGQGFGAIGSDQATYSP